MLPVSKYINNLLLVAAPDLKTGSLKYSLSSPPSPELGDYSTNAALILSKIAKKSPQELAAELSEKLAELDRNQDSLFEQVSSKAGFINFKLSQKFLADNLLRVLQTKERYGQVDEGKGKKILVEYFQPNIAKPLHLGHLPTAIIGDALFKILTAVGFRTESDTHIGDWGTQFGLLLHAYKQWGKDEVIAQNPIIELNKLYVRINTEAETNPGLREQGKAEFVKLEQGDKTNRQLWEKFISWSWQEFEGVYELLGIRRSDHNWGESFYEDKMKPVLEKLESRGLLVESQGARIVDLQKYNLGVAVVVKSDGGTTYLLRDLATYIYRKSRGFEKQIYVVDVRQKHALAQTFKILELLGEIGTPTEAVHVDFGLWSMPEGEGAFSTRRGNAIGPAELLQKAESLVLEIIVKKNPDLADKEEIARQVAVGAIKYFQLSHNVHSNLIFRWDEVLDFTGNSGPYLQYTYARAKSILRKSGSFKEPAEPTFVNAEELILLRFLAQYPEAVTQSARNYLPNYLTEYLYNLAGIFNAFYQKIRVADEPDAGLRASRQVLVAATAQVLKSGLDLLGISAPEEM